MDEAGRAVSPWARTIEAAESAIDGSAAQGTGEWLAERDERERTTVTAGRYERGELIGEGGMGRVVAAIDRQFNRKVALKEISKRAGDEAVVRRFIRESIVTGNLEHPGVPAVYERGRHEGV